MSNQTSRIHNVDVGTPPLSLSKDNEWEIINVQYHGFENLTVVRGEAVLSPEFTCFGHQWRLRLYPGGSTKSEDGMVSIFLSNRSNKSIKMQYGFSIKNRGSKAGWSGFVSKDEGYEFAARGTRDVNNKKIDSGGSRNFCTRTAIINALVDGTLIIEIRMRNVGETTTTSPFIPDNPISKNILSKFMDEESADVVFEVCGKSEEEGNAGKRVKTSTTLYAHRLILQDGATSLAEMCKLGEKSNNTIPITDVSPEIFHHMLYYLYGGKISDKELKSNAKKIIDATDRYGVVNLKLEAEAAFVTSETFTFENAIDNLLYADARNCALLKEAVMDFISENRKEATEKLTFNNVPGHVIPDLLTAVNRDDSKGSTSTDANDFSMMRVSTLRKMLHKKGLDVDGSRETMIATLKDNQQESAS